MVVGFGSVSSKMTSSSTSITSMTGPGVIVVVVGLLVLLGLRSAVSGEVPLAVAVGTLHFSPLSMVVIAAFVTFR